MSREEYRSGGILFLFNAFAVVALFFLLEPFFSSGTGSVTINETRIYYNAQWLTLYFIALAITLVLTLVFGSRRRILLNVAGIFLGSLALLSFYRLPQLVSLFGSGRQGWKIIQHNLHYLAVIVGTLLYWALLRLFDRVFR